MGRLNPFRRRCVLRIKKVYDTEQTRAMQKGDVVLARAQAKKLLPHMISEFTRSPYSHVEIYIGDGWVVSAEGVGLVVVGCARVAVEACCGSGAGQPGGARSSVQGRGPLAKQHRLAESGRG